MPTHEEGTPLEAFLAFLTVVTLGIVALIALVLVRLAMPQTRCTSTVTEFLAWCGFVGASGFVLSPGDLIPEGIPVSGWADDAGAGLRALACTSIGWKPRHRRLTTDTGSAMEPTPRFPKGQPPLWHMQAAAQRGRPS
jgi:hypothetical protein